MSRDGLIYGCTENITTQLPPLLSSPLPHWRKEGYSERERERGGGEEKRSLKQFCFSLLAVQMASSQRLSEGGSNFPSKRKKKREQSNIVSHKRNEKRKAMWDCSKTAGYCDKQWFWFRPQKLMARCLLAKRHMAWPLCVWYTLSHSTDWLTHTHTKYCLQTHACHYSVLVTHLFLHMDIECFILYYILYIL